MTMKGRFTFAALAALPIFSIIGMIDAATTRSESDYTVAGTDFDWGAYVDEPQASVATSNNEANELYSQATTKAKAGEEAGAVSLFQAAAELGHANAQFNLAAMLTDGKGGLAVNKVKAFEWLDKAAKQGHTAAQITIQRAYDSFHNKMKSEHEKFTDEGRFGEAEVLYKRAVGNSMAGLAEVAKPLFLQAAELGHADAQYNLAVMYQEGSHGLPADFAVGFEWLRKAALQDHAKAQYNLGCIYRERYLGGVRHKYDPGPLALPTCGAPQRIDGVSEDRLEALKWFLRAGELGNPKAQFNVATIYFNGEAGPVNDPAALAWFRKTASHGLDSSKESYRFAMHVVGHMLTDGKDGLTPDADDLMPNKSQDPLDHEADDAILVRKAATQGHAGAQGLLCTMYLDGKGFFPKSAVEARPWCQAAAAQGDMLAQDGLGRMHYEGKGGLPVDKGQALELYRQSAVQGHPQAQYHVAQMYVLSEGGLAYDEEQARTWFEKAAAQGDTESRYILDSMDTMGSMKDVVIERKRKAELMRDWYAILSWRLVCALIAVIVAVMTHFGVTWCAKWNQGRRERRAEEERARLENEEAEAAAKRRRKKGAAKHACAARKYAARNKRNAERNAARRAEMEASRQRDLKRQQEEDAAEERRRAAEARRKKDARKRECSAFVDRIQRAILDENEGDLKTCVEESSHLRDDALFQARKDAKTELKRLRRQMEMQQQLQALAQRIKWVRRKELAGAIRKAIGLDIKQQFIRPLTEELRERDIQERLAAERKRQDAARRRQRLQALRQDQNEEDDESDDDAVEWHTQWDTASICTATGAPDNYECPITYQLMRDPVLAADDRIYDRQAIEDHFATRRRKNLEITSPWTNLPLPSTELVALPDLKAEIQAVKLQRFKQKNAGEAANGGGGEV